MASPIRPLLVSVLIPTTLYEIGNGAIAPIIVASAIALGASVPQAAAILVLTAVGQIAGDVPASQLAHRIGDRRAMIAAAALAIAAVLGCYFAPAPVILGLGLLILGACTSVFYVARQSHLTETVPLPKRGVAMSAVGVTHRVGLLIGPLLAAALIPRAGVRSAYLIAAGSAFLAAVLILLTPKEAKRTHSTTRTKARAVLMENRRVFGTLGIAVLGISAVRTARQTVLPLWGNHLGVDPEVLSLIFGIAAAVEVSLTFLGGWIMDRFGRLASAIPSTLTMAAGMILLPFSTNQTVLVIAAVIMAAGAGLGGGLMSVLAADAAPHHGRVHFFGIWRVLEDVGNAAGPGMVSVIAATLTLTGGIVGIGLIGIVTTAGLAFWVPRRAKPT